MLRNITESSLFIRQIYCWTVYYSVHWELSLRSKRAKNNQPTKTKPRFDRNGITWWEPFCSLLLFCQTWLLLSYTVFPTSYKIANKFLISI